jgi:hypothetical protein
MRLFATYVLTISSRTYRICALEYGFQTAIIAAFSNMFTFPFADIRHCIKKPDRNEWKENMPEGYPALKLQ